MITHRPPRAYPVPDTDGLESCYNWHPGMKKNIILRVSKSSLGDFTFCSQQYYIGRIVGMKEPQNDNMLRGTNVHDSVEAFYNNMNAEYLKGLDKEKIDTYFKNCLPTPDVEYNLDEDLHLDRYKEIEVDRCLNSEIDSFLPSGNEKTINHVATIDVDGKPAMIHFIGIIDRIFTNPDGSLHIHELKTGMWKNTPTKFTNMRKEMAFYVWLLSKAEPSSRITHWGWDHTKGTPDDGGTAFRFVEPVRTKEIGLMLADLQSLVRAHRRYKGDGDGSMFPLLPPGAQYRICDPWCGVKEFCPRYQTHLGVEEE